MDSTTTPDHRVIVVDAVTGETTERELTAEEIAAMPEPLGDDK